jgi:hypothetical protein
MCPLYFLDQKEEKNTDSSPTWTCILNYILDYVKHDETTEFDINQELEAPWYNHQLLAIMICLISLPHGIQCKYLIMDGI